LINFTLGPGSTPVPLDDPAHIGQPNPGTFKFIGPVQTLKDAKKFVGITHIKTGSVVADKENGLAALARLTADFNFGLRTPSGEF
jgi:hypothetical protein